MYVCVCECVCVHMCACACVCVCAQTDGLIIYHLGSNQVPHDLNSCYKTISSKLPLQDYLRYLLPKLLDHLSTTDASLNR